MFFRGTKQGASLGGSGSGLLSVKSGSGLLDEKNVNRTISKTMTMAERQDKNSIKLLILGGGGSGKTTLRKQFSRLYNAGFKDEKSRLECREIIFNNVVEGIKLTVKAVETLGLGNDSPEFAAAVETIKALDENFVFVGPDVQHVVAAFRTLHQDAGVKQVLEQHRSRFQIQECFIVYFNQLVASYPEWGGVAWVPSVDDCVRSRVRSSGIVEVDFTHESQLFRVFDAGGQRAERRKWIHAFDDVTALIFVASLTEYDEVLFEDSTRNCLLESLEVWESVVNSTHFANVPVLLFLNKLDLFEDKYLRRGIPINVTGLFPTAPPAGTPLPAVIDWFEAEFRKLRHKPSPNVEDNLMFVHTMSAVNGSNVDAVFKAIKEIILIRSMTADGLMY